MREIIKLAGLNHPTCLRVKAYIRPGSNPECCKVRFLQGNPFLRKACQHGFAIPDTDTLPLRLRWNAEKNGHGIGNAGCWMQAIYAFDDGQRSPGQGNRLPQCTCTAGVRPVAYGLPLSQGFRHFQGKAFYINVPPGCDSRWGVFRAAGRKKSSICATEAPNSICRHDARSLFPSRYDRQWPGGRFRLPVSGPLWPEEVGASAQFVPGLPDRPDDTCPGMSGMAHRGGNLELSRQPGMHASAQERCLRLRGARAAAPFPKRHSPHSLVR